MTSTHIEELVQQVAVTPDANQLRQELEDRINDLIQTNFEGLVQLLYRVDVSEQKVRQLLQQHPQTNAAAIISQLLIERQQQKINTRQQFKNNTAINDEDAW